MNKNKQHLLHLDCLRGLSALLVCMGHLRNIFFIDFNEILVVDSFLVKFFYFITSLGHQAVMIFFVLSGFLVGGSVIKNLDNFSFKKYLTNRITRLWVVLIPCLFLTLIIDELLLSNYPELLQGMYRNVINSGPSESYSQTLMTLMGNIFFLQTIFVKTYGTLEPVWSLANEFWYYILFPLVLIILDFKKKYNLILKSFYTIFLLIILYLLPIEITKYFLIWCLGVFAFYIYDQKKSSYHKFNFLLSSILLILTLIISKLKFLSLFNSDLLISLTVSYLIVVCPKINLDQNKISKLFKNVIIHLSNISYTLYLIHFPICMLIFCYIIKFEKIYLDLPNFFSYLFYLTIIISFSYIFWFMFEKNTNLIRDIIYRKIF